MVVKSVTYVSMPNNVCCMLNDRQKKQSTIGRLVATELKL